MSNNYLTEGEKKVWAAAFAEDYRRRTLGVTENFHYLLSARQGAAIFAAKTVTAMRNVYFDKKGSVDLPALTDQERGMLMEMLG